MPRGRAAPRRAPLEVEVSDLLRHLDSATALRGNGLVDQLLGPTRSDEVVSEIKALVSRVLEEMTDQVDPWLRARALRQRTIIVRYELLRQAGKTVAADLGLSRRHFYRERRDGLLELGQRLRSACSPELGSTWTNVDVYDVAELAAISLELAGSPSQACSQFLLMAATESDTTKRIRALCNAARLLMIDMLDVDGANRAFAEAVRLLGNISHIAGGQRSTAHATIELTRALLKCRDTDANEAYQIARPMFLRTKERLRELDGAALRLQIQERLRHSNRQAWNGFPAEAMRLLHECPPLIDALQGRYAYLKVAYATVRAEVLLECEGPSSRLTDVAAKAFHLAGGQGYLGYAANAALTLSSLLAARCDPEALVVLEMALELSAKTNSPRDVNSARLHAARIFNEFRQPQRVIALVNSAIAAPASQRFRLNLQLQRAQALLLLGNIDRARRNAAECYELAKHIAYDSAGGLALQILGQCEHALGHYDEARRLCAESLETMQMHSSVRSLYFSTREATRILQLSATGETFPRHA